MIILGKDFEIEYTASKIGDDTVLVTGSAPVADFKKDEERILAAALAAYENTGTGTEIKSVYPSDTTTSTSLTLDYITTLANGLNTNLSNLQTANALILQSVLADSFVGRAWECIYSNINSDYKLTYGNVGTDTSGDEDGDSQEVAEVKALIKQFNRDVDLRTVIRDAISGCYLEGNYVMYLRSGEGLISYIDHYPLSIAAPSYYRSGGSDVIEFNISELRSRLSKQYRRNRRSQPLYYNNANEEVASTFPAEVVKAYNDGERYCALDSRYADCLKVNDFGRQYGVSPLFKCLKPLLVIQSIQTADVASSGARQKIILYQKLRKELGGTDGKALGLDRQQLAHQNAASALQTNLSLYTSPWWVESLEFVQADETTDAGVDRLELYNSILLAALGIGFTDSGASLSVANIGVSQLMKVVNSIAERLERIIEKFYRTYLEDNGYDPSLAPSIKIIDSEQMEFSLRKDLAQFLFTTMNCSWETALGIVGVDVNDEYKRRKAENEKGYESVFTSRATSYTSGGNNTDEGGRPPSSDDQEKQEYDETYNQEAR